MHLYLDSRGAFLGIKEGLFWVKPKDRPPADFAVRTVQSIYLAKGVRVSTDALLLALEHDIPVLLQDRLGRTVGQVWSGHYGSIATIRKHQALFVQHPAGWQWMSQTLAAKLAAQVALLQQVGETYGFDRDQQQAMHQHVQATLQQLQQRFAQWQPPIPFDASVIAAQFRGWEGTASRSYFFALSQLIPSEYGFNGRAQHPAKDRFNATLNYLYGILYSRVQTSLMRAGLDPFMGILHADRYNRPTLVYDAIEPYRPWADAVALALFQPSAMPLSYFQPGPKEGLWLHTQGKQQVLDAFHHFLHQKISYQNRQRQRRHCLEIDATRLAQQLKTFQP